MSLYSLIRHIYHRLESYRRERYIKGLTNRGLQLGQNVEIISDFFFDPSHCFLISIGDNSTICPNVRLIAHDASTKKFLGYTKLGRIDIKENCFIGDSTIILPDVTIGPNSIVGSGSVVTKDVPPGVIAAGNPARIIMSLDEYINKIRLIAEGKTVFGEDYFIDRLDDDKRREIIQSVGNSIGFIV